MRSLIPILGLVWGLGEEGCGRSPAEPPQRFIIRLGEVGLLSLQARQERQNPVDIGRCCAAGFLNFYFINLAVLSLGGSTWLQKTAAAVFYAACEVFSCGTQDLVP